MKGMRPSVLTAGFVVLKSSEAVKNSGDPEKKKFVRKLTVLYGVGLGTGKLALADLEPSCPAKW